MTDTGKRRFWGAMFAAALVAPWAAIYLLRDIGDCYLAATGILLFCGELVILMVMWRDGAEPVLRWFLTAQCLCVILALAVGRLVFPAAMAAAAAAGLGAFAAAFRAAVIRCGEDSDFMYFAGTVGYLLGIVAGVLTWVSMVLSG
ncbi:MAG: hypothetical protein AB7F40_04150 [Victivallaceae bacterium]|nr:hypothetical protein [Victivallaceae bacterium]